MYRQSTITCILIHENTKNVRLPLSMFFLALVTIDLFTRCKQILFGFTNGTPKYPKRKIEADAFVSTFKGPLLV